MKTISYVLSSLAVAGAFFIAPAFAAELETQVPQSEDVIAVDLAADSSAIADRGEGGKECGDRLNFTDAQLEKMAALKDQYMLATAGKKAELHSLMRQMMDQLTQPTIDRAKITGIHDKMAALRTDLSNARLAYAMDRADVLTADQRKEIHHRMLLHQLGHGHWGHHGGMHHHGFGHHHEGPEHEHGGAGAGPTKGA